ncbi:MAG: Uma2 family endonuclease [Chloroflexota bacterium]
MAVAAKTLTIDQFLELPEEKLALEFIDGTVTSKVSPKGKHSRLQVELAMQLATAGKTNRRAFTFTELRTTFGGASRVPDITVYLRERVPIDEAGEIANDFREPPDIAIEIVSPEQSVNELVRRCLWYVDQGVTIALLVDPQDKSVLAFRSSQTPAVWRADDRIDLHEVLPDFALSVGELFATLRLE